MSELQTITSTGNDVSLFLLPPREGPSDFTSRPLPTVGESATNSMFSDRFIAERSKNAFHAILIEDEPYKEIAHYFTSMLRGRESVIEHEAIASRIETLISLSESESGCPKPSPRSLLKLLSFLSKHGSLKRPSISIGPQGRIAIQWRESRTKKFYLEFMDDGQVIFVLLTPDRLNPMRIKRISGKTAVDSVLDELVGYELADWINHHS